MTEEQHSLKETITYPLIETYLHHFVPQGYRSNWALQCGTPRSEEFHTLAGVLTYYRGGRWYIPGQGNEIYQVVEQGRIIYCLIDDVLYHFVGYINLLHNERPGYWCGDVTFGEARKALEDAKLQSLQQKQIIARQQQAAEIQAWCQQYKSDDPTPSSGHTYDLYMKRTSVMMQRITIRSRSPFHRWEEPARRALGKVRESRWKMSTQQEIEVYNEFGQRIIPAE